MSLKVREKNATSDPASKKEMIKRKIIINTSTVVAAGVIASKEYEKKVLTE
jgi:hypothetical protein